MIGIHFSGTGNSKYALEVFLREVDNNSVLFSIEDKKLIDNINNHDEIVFSYPVQYSAVPKYLSDFIHNNSEMWRGKIMNKEIARIGSIIVTVTVILFAAFMFVSQFGSFFVCMFLALGYLMMIAGYHNECSDDRKVAANVGLIFGCIYAVLILLVYFAQTTAVRTDSLNEQAIMILDYSRGGLLFSYDLLGYGMMALSTFFMGLTIKPKNKKDRWLKYLMMIHGIFFVGCFVMPMTGIFSASMSDGSDSIGGIIALEFWCAYFLPIGILSVCHFKKD